MKLGRLNCLTALIAFLASALWFATGQNVTGLIWLACSLVWLVLAVARMRSSKIEFDHTGRLFRRLHRLLLWS
jgi:hypothetical protein